MEGGREREGRDGIVTERGSVRGKEGKIKKGEDIMERGKNGDLIM